MISGTGPQYAYTLQKNVPIFEVYTLMFFTLQHVIYKISQSASETSIL